MEMEQWLHYKIVEKSGQFSEIRHIHTIWFNVLLDYLNFGPKCDPAHTNSEAWKWNQAKIKPKGSIEESDCVKVSYIKTRVLIS